jgi:hypothetical protein
MALDTSYVHIDHTIQVGRKAKWYARACDRYTPKLLNDTKIDQKNKIACMWWLLTGLI